MSRSTVQQGWVEFLSQYRWDWFTSQTFRLSTHPEAADKLFRVWISMLNRHLYGPRWHKQKKSVYWVRALEWQKRGVLHFHALVSAPDRISANGSSVSLNLLAKRLYWMDQWNTLAGFARIEKPDSATAVVNYCTKYILKDGDLELSPFMPSFNPGVKPLELHRFGASGCVSNCMG